MGNTAIIPFNPQLVASTNNFMGYYEIEADRVRPLGSRILATWDFKKDTLLGGKLLSSEITKGHQYTGTIVKLGISVGLDINIGDRIIFLQFSDFKKFFDPKYGRMAMINEYDAIALVPPRKDGSPDPIKLECGEQDYDYSA